MARKVVKVATHSGSSISLIFICGNCTFNNDLSTKGNRKFAEMETLFASELTRLASDKISLNNLVQKLVTDATESVTFYHFWPCS